MTQHAVGGSCSSDVAAIGTVCAQRFRPIRFNLERARVLQPFPNTGQSYADVSCLPKAIQNFSRHSPAEILNGKDNLCGVFGDAHVNRAAPGMTMNIGESFLQNSEQRSLGPARQPAQVLGKFQGRGDSAASPETLNIPSGCGDETRLIEQRRMKQMREGARIGDTAIHQLARILKMRGVAFPLLGEHIQTDLGGGESWPKLS